MQTKNKGLKATLCLLLCVLVLVGLSLPLNAEASSVQKEVYLGGTLFGASMLTDGVPIVSIDSVETESGVKAPAHDAGLKVRDIIKEINGVKVTTSAEVTSFITECEGKVLTVTFLRGGKTKSVSLTPLKGKDGVFRAGIWIRDSAAGIGTVTYIEPETLEFAGLGHGICDGDASSLLPLLRGSDTYLIYA